jgi:hypothetical protein
VPPQNEFVTAQGDGVGVGVTPDWAQYLPPVFVKWEPSFPPHTIISLPVHTAVCEYRALGALVVLVAVQLSVAGLYLPPVSTMPPPPQTIISLPVQTAVCEYRALGALMVLVALQVLLGLYLPPVSRIFVHGIPEHPPHIIISLPVHTAV